jgi:hypothetical protein
MIGSLNKSYDFPIIVSAEDLKSLSYLLSSGFEELRYYINTKDGARYTLNSLEEVLNYSNTDGRNIQRLCVRGNKKKGESFIYPNIYVSLLDKSVYTTSCEFEIYQLDETEICYYTQRIDEFTKKIKAPYWWLHKSAFYWITGFLLYFLSAIFYFHYVDNIDPVDRVYNILVLQGVSAFCMYISMVFINKIVCYFFPECYFAIGEQIKRIEKLNKLKKFIFLTVIFALIMGVLSSIIAYFIVKLF